MAKYKPDFGPNGDMVHYEDRLIQDFSIFPPIHVKLRGVYHPNSHMSYVYPVYHENIEDIISTCSHEAIHHAIMTKDFDIDDEVAKVDEEQEHMIIRFMMWADHVDWDRPNYAERE